MVRDQKIMRAVSRVLQRSERQEDMQKLLGTFVDVGVLPQLDNQNHQIFYGRRGTGKTHVFKVLDAQLREDENNVVVYIDARTLGSTAQYSDSSVPLRQRCLALFRDVLLELYQPLLEHIVEFPSTNAERALGELDHLMAGITEPVKTYREKATDETFENAESGKVTSGITGDTGGKIGLSIEADSEESSRRQSTTSHQVDTEDKVIFPLLNRNLSNTLELAEAHLYILLDEWSSLPADIQPYLAEFLKRGVLTVQRATLKIASLEYRSHFTKLDTQPGVGFELGADIATAQDLDEYYVFDRNPEQITDTYANMLLRHLNSELEDNYLTAQYHVHTGKDLASRLFTERKTFEELARASEGVVRDLINIFTSAFFDSQRRSRDSIDRKSILDAARQWFEQDKQQYLDEHLQAILRKIVDEVIGTRRARSFLLPRGLEWDPTIQRLFDARVLHLM